MLNMNRLAKCDVCKNEVEISKALYRIRKTGELEYRYLRCPHCGTAYLQEVTDKKVRKLLRNQMATVRAKKEAIKTLTDQHRGRFAELVEHAYVPKTP